MSEKEEIIAVLKGLLISGHGSVVITLRQCDRDYREVVGSPIPYQKLGYGSLIEMFQSIPGFRLSEGSKGEWLINMLPSQASNNIADLVAKQKSSKKRSNKFFQPPQQRRVKNDSWKPSVSSNIWKYSNSQGRVSQAYFKPQSNSPKKVASYPKAPAPAPVSPVFVPPAPVKSNLKINIENKVQNKLPKRVVVNDIPNTSIPPSSSLSGLRPGDILAKASTNLNYENPSNFKSTVQGKYIVRSSAADRMSALKIKLQNEPAIHVPEKSHVDELREEINNLKVDTNYKENKSRLSRLCRLLKLPDPVIKTHENINKHQNPSTFDCSVKVGVKYSHSTYPNSLSTCELAVETAASKVLEMLHGVALENNSTKPSSSPSIAVERIVKIVAEHPNGLWASGIPDIYINKFEETLPTNWLTMAESSSQIQIEKGATSMLMLFPASETTLFSTSSTPSISDDDLGLSDSIESLQYPEDSQWKVFIMSANSTVEIWLRIIGEQYSDAFESLNADMELYFNDISKPSNNIAKGGWYAIKCEDGWFRTQVLEIDFLNCSIVCFLVDTGDEETHQFSNLYDLPQQFLKVAPQAILCRLAGLEEYSMGKLEKFNLSEKLVGKSLIADVLQTPEELMSGDDPTITVVLYDTSSKDDINLNKELLYELTQKAKSPHLSQGIVEIYICDVTPRGTVFAQIHNENFKLLKKMLGQVVMGPFPKETLQASSHLLLKPNTYYLAKSSSGEWRRAVLYDSIRSLADDSYVNVKYIDYGTVGKVSVKDLLLLERLSVALNSYPVQVLELKLHNVTDLNPDNLRRLNELLPRDVPVICKSVDDGVELFVRTQPHDPLCCVNKAIDVEIEMAKKINTEVPNSDLLIELSKKKERIFSNFQLNQSIKESPTTKEPIPKFQLPKKGSQFNIFVSLAVNPSNFTVQPLQDQDELAKMMDELQSVGKSPELTVTPKIGCAYAAYYDKEDYWYRVFVQGIVSRDMASIYFCDYGDLQMVEISKLRELPSNFKKLPAQALKARLHGVSPINRDWFVEDCLRFQDLVVEKKFVSIIENVERDPLHTNESLLTLNLIDTSTNDDVYINNVLCKENRAKMI
ncbi:tudor domain-containing protein 7 tapas [Arctopsyche grandis]|uniref:tudor domain-containing protein 7 tapas n=1 Tax=Arctopsyche grandis TaxID=121162 RepID=UPI00406D8D34